MLSLLQKSALGVTTDFMTVNGEVEIAEEDGGEGLTETAEEEEEEEDTEDAASILPGGLPIMTGEVVEATVEVTETSVVVMTDGMVADTRVDVEAAMVVEAMEVAHGATAGVTGIKADGTTSTATLGGAVDTTRVVAVTIRAGATARTVATGTATPRTATTTPAGEVEATTSKSQRAVVSKQTRTALCSLPNSIHMIGLVLLLIFFFA